MGYKSIGYHTRLYENNNQKVCGGSFGGAIDTETIERLVNNHFSVIVKPSGTPVFVDRQGREVSLYLTVDVKNTEKGKIALKEWYAERERLQAIQEEKEKKELEEIDTLMDGLTHDEIIRRLKIVP
jgi:hypothetical protein